MKDHRKYQSSLVTDIGNMHQHYNFDEPIDKLDHDSLMTLLKFRLDFIQEEVDETFDNSVEHNFCAEEVVDGLIDIMVVTIGTLDLFNINTQRAWDVVHAANMNKKVGIKEGRPNPLNLPDLMKPEGWTAPSHEGNHGRLGEMEAVIKAKGY